jgi:transposase
MMGRHDRSEALFYYFRLEDQVPENHLLRLIEKHVSFEFVREQLVEELRMHLAWRWFTGLGFDQEIPHHSTFSKNRHGRFRTRKYLDSYRSSLNEWIVFLFRMHYDY